MSKKLPTHGIANELSGASVFFQSAHASEATANPPDAAVEPTDAMPVAEPARSPETPSVQPRNHDGMPSRNHDSTHARPQERKQSFMQDGVMANHLDEIRKAVKQLGKELSTHRFTVEEKTALADIIYTYTRQGMRTSENEITRIGVNWLLLDYRHNGANSVLARLLERLHG